MLSTAVCASRPARQNLVFVGLIALLLTAGCTNSSQAQVTIDTPSLPAGVVASAEGGMYSATLSATGGTEPYTWMLTSAPDTFPPGLTLDSAGSITGMPSTAGTYNFTVQVTDAQGNSNSIDLRIYIYSGV